MSQSQLTEQVTEYLIEKKVDGRKGHSGNLDGNLHKRSRQLSAQLKDLDCDPVEFLANVMAGKAMKEQHPFLEHVISFVNAILNIPDLISDNGERERFKERVQVLLKSAHHYLYEGYVPIELQTKVGIELLQYIHAKRKTIEVADDANLIETNARAVADKYDTLFDNAKEAKLVVSEDSVKIEKKE